MRPRHPLPSLWLMTDERIEDVAAALRRLPRGAGVVFRHYATLPAERRRLWRRLLRIARARGLMLVRAGSTREKPEIAILRHAAASGCVALLVAASISGGSIDLGLLFCVLAGLACASSLPRGRFAGSRAVAGAPLGAPRLAASEGG